MIGLFGDSFGFQKKNEPYPSWVDLLDQHHTIDNHSECGVSEYKILRQLQFTNLDSYDTIIITHTSYSRVFVEYNPLHATSLYHKNCDILYADIESNTDEFSHAGQLYFKYIFDDNYAKDMHNLVLKEIEEVVGLRKVVHMTHFDHAGLRPLPDLLDFHTLFLNNRGQVNHYNEAANEIIFNTVLQRLL